MTTNIRQLTLTALFLTGLLAALIWLHTEWSAWKGVMLERRVNQGEPVSAQTLVTTWAHVKELDQVLVPGPHVHIPGLAARPSLIDWRIDMAAKNAQHWDSEFQNLIVRQLQ